MTNQVDKPRAVKVIERVIPVIAVGALAYHMTQIVHILQGPIEHQDTHYAIMSVLVFLVAWTKKPKFWPLWVAMILVALVSTGYVRYFYGDLEWRAGNPTVPDQIIGWMLVLVALVGAQRAFGWVLTAVSLVCILYAFVGQYLPGVFYHYPLEMPTIISAFSIGLSGMFGTPLGVSAKYIFLFIVFGSILNATGASTFIFAVGRWMGHIFRSGPAMTAVISSSMIGTCTGSAVANTAITGAFTIPMMKKIGYKPHQAGAIEAVASTGGQIMPPVMGSTAFLMAELLGTSYISICVMAIIPAVIYYFGAAAYAQLQAMKLKVTVIAEEGENLKRDMLQSAHLFIVPLGTLVFLLIMHFSPMFAAFWAIIAAIVVGFLKKNPLTPRKLVENITEGAISGAGVAMAIAVTGPVIATLTMTGLGLKLPSAISDIAGGSLIIAMILTMVISIIMGCGFPTIIAYLLVALYAGPILIRMGLPTDVSHFFVFIAAVSAAITPPIALAALTAAGIAGTGFWKTAIESMKAGFMMYLLPFLIVWSPFLLMRPSDILSAVLGTVSVILTVVAVVIVTVGYYLTTASPLERLVSSISALALLLYLFSKSIPAFIIGIIVFGLLTFWQWRKAKVENSAPLSAST